MIGGERDTSAEVERRVLRAGDTELDNFHVSGLLFGFRTFARGRVG